MGQLEALVAQLELAQQQHVDVDRARAVARAAGRPSELALDGLRRVQQRLGPQSTCTCSAALRKAGWSRTSPTGSVS